VTCCNALQRVTQASMSSLTTSNPVSVLCVRATAHSLTHVRVRMCLPCLCAQSPIASPASPSAMSSGARLSPVMLGSPGAQRGGWRGGGGVCLHALYLSARSLTHAGSGRMIRREQRRNLPSLSTMTDGQIQCGSCKAQPFTAKVVCVYYVRVCVMMMMITLPS
jgi:hypothetical protein